MIQGIRKLMRFVLPLLIMFLTSIESGQPVDASVYVATYIDLQLGSTEQGLSLIRQYREATRTQAGSSRIDVVQEIARPNRFGIIEAWRDQSSFDTHDRSAQALQFRTRLKTIENSPSDQRVHKGFAIDRRELVFGRDAVVVVTHVDVPPQRKDETEVLLRRLAEESRKDEDNLRYEVFQQNPSTNHFTIVAVWKNRKGFDSYEIRPHTRQFREALAPLLGAPYDERLYSTK